MTDIVPKKKTLQDYIVFSSAQYYCIPLLYALQFYLIQKYENPYIFIWIVYSFIPVLDALFPLDLRNPTKEEAKSLEDDYSFKLPLYVSLFCDWFFTYWYISYICSHELSFFTIIGFCSVAGHFAASNINIAHELMHKSNWLDKTFGMLTLSKNMYMHFYIEHNWGHHKNVATPKDPATSRYNQTLYGFLPQTIIGSYRSAWGIEKRRLLEQEKLSSVWTYKNRMIWFTLNDFLIPFLTFLLFGLQGMTAFLFTAVFSIVYLEAVNYIEHYGMKRKEISPGEYEKVTIHHSWNAPHRLSNYLLFKLQRHSDHHENAYKPYQTLCSYEESPHLPQGYTVCILIGAISPLWFSIMNPIVECYWKNTKVPKEVMDRAQLKIYAFIFFISLFTFVLMMLGFNGATYFDSLAKFSPILF